MNDDRLLTDLPELGEMPNDRGSARPCELVQRMIDAFAEAEIQYCHWKSNRNLENALQGNEDLDILGRRSDAARIAPILARLDLKPARSGLDRIFPGIEDYYGLDERSLHIVHLQLHYQLVLGEPLIKNYHFPIEHVMLEDRIDDGAMPVPQPRCELAVYVLRTLLKVRVHHLLRRSGVEILRKEARKEIPFLLDGTTVREAAAFTSANFPGVDEQLYSSALTALWEGASTSKLLSLKRRVAREISDCRRRPGARAFAALLVRRANISIGRIRSGVMPRRHPMAGGLLIAITGADGSGKSTAVEALKTLLIPYFDLGEGLIGKPPKRSFSRAVDLLVGLVRKRFPETIGPARVGPTGHVNAPAFLQLLFGLQLACLATDRLREYRRMLGMRRRGLVIFSDRYPIPGIISMEAPLSDKLKVEANRWTRRWAKIEQEAHAAIGNPDLLLILRVHPDLAVSRQPEDGSEFVRWRSQEVWDLTEDPPAGGNVIDAHQSALDVRRQIMRLVWAEL
jgi:energy-coupling factor transporter ATP-binding protein EcfA2